MTGQKVCSWKGHLEVQPPFSSHPGPFRTSCMVQGFALLELHEVPVIPFTPACQGPSRWWHSPLVYQTVLLGLGPLHSCWGQSNPTFRSLMEMLNRCGLSTDPLDVPLVTGLQLDFTASPLGLAYRESKNHKNHKRS